MSDEREVSPLRLKRSDAGGPPTSPNTPDEAPSAPPVSGAPLMPLPGVPPAPPAGNETIPPERPRRRLSLNIDDVVPPSSATSGAATGKTEDESAAPAPTVLKLKVGVRPPPLPPSAIVGGPEPTATSPGPAASTSEPPLMPLPGFGPGGASKEPPLVPLPVPPQVGGSMSGMVPGVVGLPPPRPETASAAASDSVTPPALPANVAKAALARHRPRRDALFFGILFLLLIGAGAGAYFYFAKPEVADEVAGAAREKLAQAAQLPGKALDEARQSLDGAREKEQARVDSVLDDKEPPAERAVGNVTPGEMQAKPRERNNDAPSRGGAGEPGASYSGEPVAAESPPAPQSVQPSARFLRYAEGIRVSGVFQGSPARALVDGRIIRQGELLEPALGIRFAEVDAQAKQLVLEDTTGARVRVRY